LLSDCIPGTIKKGIHIRKPNSFIEIEAGMYADWISEVPRASEASSRKAIMAQDNLAFSMGTVA